MSSISTRTLGVLLAIVVTMCPQSLWACSACFGKSDAPMAQGMNMGIFTLLIVIVSVLIGIAAFFAYIVRRAARMESAALAGTQNASVPAKSAVGPEVHSI